MTRTGGSTDLPDGERLTYTVRETAAVMGLSLGVTYELLRANFRQRVWLPALARSGVVERPTFHDLRHCYATWLVSEGCQ
jgi:integrase